MKCKGCGVEIQTINEKAPGYIPIDVLERRLGEGKEVYCKRCFSLKHYGKLSASFQMEHSLDLLKKYLSLANNVLYIVDIFDFEGTFRKEVQELLSGKNVFYLINKVDLIPKEITPSEIKSWVKNRLKVQSTRIRLLSARNNRGISGLLKFLKEKKEKRFITVGVANVGKSSVLNALAGMNTLTISRYPGTTLEAVEFHCKEHGLSFIDTPGIITGDRVTDLLDNACQSRTIPEKKLVVHTIKPKKKTRTVFLSGFVKIDVQPGKLPGPIFHVISPESVTVHETNPEIAKEKWESWFGAFLFPPCSSKKLGAHEWKSVNLKLLTGQEVAIKGLGWINVARGPIEITITHPGNTEPIVRNGLIGPLKFKK
ncbi:hypothetical protein AT15_00635 [Kosmotoga arenicorallina S304]|uniref:Uncharacterized protein n=1 Tax=Kosmotoga arenicorallina S304 TaxID=1453497 RepID=A0A176K0C3_9BACT|nr:GTPase [Kosmotoga arenicorallina]OAA30052.1 hypothetical protein AT15_00635 [Kosmotoga arenicorallina S304]